MKINENIIGNEKELEKERELLDRLAEESLRQGKSLSEDENVLRQARIVDSLLLKEVELQKMLDEFVEEESVE